MDETGIRLASGPMKKRGEISRLVVEAFFLDCRSGRSHVPNGIRPEAHRYFSAAPGRYRNELGS
jgi:hypothetical protein